MFWKNPNSIPVGVVASPEEIPVYTERVLNGEIPGFQISSRIFSPQSTLDGLAALVRSRVPGFVFNNVTDSRKAIYGDAWQQLPESMTQGVYDAGPHFDRNLAGIAVHVNIGSGKIRLRANKNVYAQVIHLGQKQIDYEKCGKGPWYEGILSAGKTVTVFAEDMMTSGHISPVLHDFTTDNGAWRHWQRYAYLP